MPNLLSLEFLLPPFYAAAATAAFALLFGLRSVDIILAALGAALGRAVFQFFPIGGSEAIASFFAALAAGLYSETAGWFRRRPATAYMIASIIPLVPGGGMYYTMLRTFEGDSSRSLEEGLTTLMVAFSLAVGLAISNAAGRLIFKRQLHMRAFRTLLSPGDPHGDPQRKR
jgi:uncharacterized membrane protein YjjB (DUF3815 family)